MKIDSLEYAKTVKVLAQLEEIVQENCGTFFEWKLTEFRGRLLIAAANRWRSAIQKTRPNKSTVFVIEDDVAFARKKWVRNERKRNG